MGLTAGVGLFVQSFGHPQAVEYHHQYLHPNVIKRKILADKMAQAVVIDDGNEAVDRRPDCQRLHDGVAGAQYSLLLAQLDIGHHLADGPATGVLERHVSFAAEQVATEHYPVIGGV